MSRLASSLIALTLMMPAAAFSQTQAGDPQTRSEGLSSARDAKARDLTPPKSSLIERALLWYDEHDGQLQYRGIHFAGGGFPNGAGFGFGIGITKRAIGAPLAEPALPNRVDVTLAAARTTLGYQRLGARVELLNAGGRPIDFAVSFLDEKRPREDYYGLGQDSREANRTEYRLDGTQTAIDLRWRPAARVAIGGGVALLTPEVTATTPEITALPDFLRSSVFLTFDGRDNPTHPRDGGRYRAAWAFYHDQSSGASDFRRIDLDAQQIVPLGNRYRRLELRAAAAITGDGGRGAVPVIYQPVLGGSFSLRGFRDSRFRDRNALWLGAEYQWEAWWALDAAVFADAGQVMNRWSDVTADRMEVTYGFGLRLHTNNAFVARIDFGFSREGFMPIVGFKYGF